MRPWTLKPDRLALAPPEEVAEGYTFEKVGQKYVLTDGTKVMEIYNVQGLAHAQGMLMAYLPKEKIVVEADSSRRRRRTRRCRRWSPRPHGRSTTTCSG